MAGPATGGGAAEPETVGSTKFLGQVVEGLEAKGLRNKYKVIVGGGPVTPQWAEQIGADGFSKDAVEAVELAKSLLK